MNNLKQQLLKGTMVMVITVTAASAGKAEFDTTANVKKVVCPNGLTLIHKENKSNAIVAIDLFIKVGSLNETESEKGLTTLMQGMLIKGTKNKSAEEVSEIIESVGGVLNAGGYDDYSEVSVMVTKPDFMTGWNLMYEVVSEPAFTKNHFEKEQKNMIAGIKSRQEEIYVVCTDIFNSLLYGKHPYAYPINGTIEAAEKFKREDVVNHHNKYFVPENMILVVVGNVNWDEVKSAVDKSYGLLKRGTVNAVIDRPVPPVPLTKPVEKTENRKFKQAFMMLGYLFPESNNEDYAALKMLNAILGTGMNSRLFSNLRDKDSLAYELGSFYPTRKDKSRFAVFIGLDDNRVDEAKGKILNELKRITTEFVDDKELLDTKTFLRGNYFMDHATNKQQAWYLGWWELIGKGYEYDKKYADDLAQVTKEQIKLVAAKYFSDNYLTVIVRPEK